MSSYGARTFEIGGRVYTWYGWFGAIVKSYERGVKEGDVRIIGDEMLYAYIVYPSRWFRKSEISWSIPNPTIERINELHKKFMGV